MVSFNDLYSLSLIPCVAKVYVHSFLPAIAEIMSAMDFKLTFALVDNTMIKIHFSQNLGTNYLNMGIKLYTFKS